MPTSSFKLFDENKANMLTDSEYSSNAQRLNGVQSGVASSKLQNKFQYQASLVAYAIAQLMVQNGYDATDSTAVTTFVNNMSNTMLQKVIDKATDAQAKEGTNTTKWMTPALVKSAITELAPMVSAILSNETKTLYGLDNTATPDDVFKKINEDISGNIGDIKLSATEINDPAWHKCDGSLFKFTGNEALVALNMSNRVMAKKTSISLSGTSDVYIYSVCCCDDEYAVLHREGNSIKLVITEDFDTIKVSYDITNVIKYLYGTGRLFWRNNQFVLFAKTGDSNSSIFTSPTGEAWTEVVSYKTGSKNFPNMDNALDANFIYYNGVYYCCTDTKDNYIHIYSSTDLVTWEDHRTGDSYVVNIGGMAVGNGYLVVGTQQGKDVVLYYLNLSTNVLESKIIFSYSTSSASLNYPYVYFLNGKFYSLVVYKHSGSYTRKVFEWSDFSSIEDHNLTTNFNISEYLENIPGTEDQLAGFCKGNDLYLVYGGYYYRYNVVTGAIEGYIIPPIVVDSSRGYPFSSNKHGFVAAGIFLKSINGNANSYGLSVSYLTNNQYPFIDHGYIKIS